MDSPKQSSETTSQQRTENAITQRNPAWWTGRHVSTWERVKEAFRRDWEQTKSDFSKGSGRDLEQSAGDTISQAIGSARTPALNEKTHLATRERAFPAGETTLDRSTRMAEGMVSAQDDLNRAKLSEDTSEVTEKLKREEASEAWAQAEREAKYGFAARAQHHQFSDWNPALEATLRGEWMDMETGRSWEEAMPGVRRGWEFAKPQTH